MRTRLAALAIALALLAPLTPLRAEPAAPARLEPRELLAATRAGLEPTARARALAGTRVTMTGFMAEVEDPSPGGFWLVSRPVHCDEGGAGTGDLPPDAVRVVARGRPRERFAQVQGPVAVTGLLELGPADDGTGQVSAFRLLVDPPAGAAAPALPSQPSNPSHKE